MFVFYSKPVQSGKTCEVIVNIPGEGVYTGVGYSPKTARWVAARKALHQENYEK